MKNHYIIKIKAIFLIFFFVTSYSFSNSIEDHTNYYIFKNNSERLIAPEVDFSKNAPVNQLKLEAISIDFYKIKNEILKSGYIEHKENAPLSKKRYEIEPNLYGINKIFFLVVVMSYLKSHLQYIQLEIILSLNVK